MFLLVMSETLALFVDTLTADDKYSLCNRENLQQKIQVHLSKKKRFFRIFCSSWLEKCLRNLVSEHRLTFNMLKVPKHCCNLHNRNFMIFFHHFDQNIVGKYLS